MTRPDPLEVECDYCGAKRRRPCLVNPGAYRHLLKQREPHAARLRAYWEWAVAEGPAAA